MLAGFVSRNSSRPAMTVQMTPWALISPALSLRGSPGRTVVGSACPSVRADTRSSSPSPRLVEFPTRNLGQEGGRRGAVLLRSRALARAQGPTESIHPTRETRHHIRFAGGGIYFFWQLGVAKYLREHYNLAGVEMSGTSCGALCATLTACGVDPNLTVERAYQLSVDNDLWSRPLGLVGIWGQLILEWLEDLLPDDSWELCRDRVQIAITEIPGLRQIPVQDFTSKEDLIAVNMASIHIPVFLDWRLTRSCRGKQCVDGSLRNVVLRQPPALPIAKTSDHEDVCVSVITVDHNMDKRLQDSNFGFLKLREYEEVLKMMDLGYDFARQQDAVGVFTGLPFSSFGPCGVTV